MRSARHSRPPRKNLPCECTLLLSAEKAKLTSSRMAYYLAALLALYDLAPRLSKLTRPEIASKLPGLPSQMLDGLLSRFTEPLGKKFAVTEKTKTKLLAWICVVYLHLDAFNAEVGKMAKELNMPQPK